MSTPEDKQNNVPTQYEEEDDGLSSFSLQQLGQKANAFGGAKLLKFNSGAYITTAGETITADREFVLAGLVKLVQKFVGKKLVTFFVVPQKEKFPAITKMNEKAPPEEWGVDLNGKPKGPWSHLLVLKLLDREMNEYAFITNSTGGGIAVSDLTKKIKMIRRLKGPEWTVAVTCEHGIRFKSGYNPAGVPRPSFRIARYVRFAGGGSGDTPLLTQEVTTPPTEVRPSMTAEEQLNVFSSDSNNEKKVERKYDFLELPTKPKPPLKEDMGDELPI